MIKSILLAAMAAGSVAYAASASSSSESKAVLDLSASDVFVDLRALCGTDSPWELLPSLDSSEDNSFRWLGCVDHAGDLYCYFSVESGVAPVWGKVVYSNSTDVDSSTGEFLGDDVSGTMSVVSARQSGCYWVVKGVVSGEYTFSAGTSHRFSPKSLTLFDKALTASDWSSAVSFGKSPISSIDYSWKDLSSGDKVWEFYHDNYVVVDDKVVDLACVDYINAGNNLAKRIFNDSGTEVSNSSHELYYCFFNIGGSSRPFSSVSRVDYGFALYSYDYKYRIMTNGPDGTGRVPKVYPGTDVLYSAPLKPNGDPYTTYSEHSAFNVSAPSYYASSCAPGVSKFDDSTLNVPIFSFNVYKNLDYSYSDLVALDESSISSCGGSDSFKRFLLSFSGSYSYAFRVYSGDRFITDYYDSINNVNDFFGQVKEVVTHCQGISSVQVFRLGFVDKAGLSFDLNAIDVPVDVTEVSPQYGAETVPDFELPFLPGHPRSWLDDFLAKLAASAKALGIILATVLGVFGGLFLSSKISSIVSSESSDKKGRS